MRHALAVTLMGAVLVPAGAALPAGAASGPLVGTAGSVGTHPATTAPDVTLLGAGAHGLLYASTVNDDPGNHLFYWADGAPRWADLGATVGTNGVLDPFERPSLVGDVLATPAFSDAGAFTGVNLSDPGTGSPVSPGFMALPDPTDTYLGQDGSALLLGRVDGAGNWAVYRAPFTGAALTEVVQAGQGITDLHADASGVLLTYTTDPAHTLDGNTAHLVYLPTGGAPVALADVPGPTALVNAALDPEGVVYGQVGAQPGGAADRVHVYWRNGAPPVAVDLSRPVTGVRFAVTGGRLVWSANQDADAPVNVQDAVSGAPVTGATPTSRGPLLARPDGGVLVFTAPLQSGAVRQPQLTQISATGTPTAFGAPLPYRPANVTGLSLSGGRLIVQDTSNDPQAFTQYHLTPSGNGSMTGFIDHLFFDGVDPADACTGWCQPVLTSGDWTVRQGIEPTAADGNPNRLLVTNGNVPMGDMPGSGHDELLSLAGPHLLYLDHRNGGSALTLVDLRTGAARVLNDSTATVGATTLYEAPVGNQGTITTTDLNTGATGTRVLDPVCAVDVHAALTHWLLYSCGTQNRVLDLTTGASVTLPAGAQPRLGDGFVGLGHTTFTTGQASTDLSVMDLTDPTHPLAPVATLTGASDGTTTPSWAVDTDGGQMITYERADHDVMVAPVNVTASPVAVVTRTLPATFLPLRGEHWRPVLQTTKPVTWTMTVTDPTSAATVWTQSQTGPGVITVAPDWDGKTPTGAIANGPYRWTLTLAPADGAGDPLTLTGTVTPDGQWAALTSTSTPAGFTPDGDGVNDTWAAKWSANKPLAWMLTVGGTNTATGKTFTVEMNGSGTTFAPAWTGQSGGVLVGDGAYAWQLTATPHDGFSHPITATGTVGVRTRPVTTTVKATGYSSDARTDGATLISWSSARPVGVTGWDLAYREISTGSTGARVYGPIHPWLANTTATSAAFWGARGHSYQVLVTAHDTIRPKNPATAVTVNTVADDRDSVLRYSTGWAAPTGSNRYRGTLRTATARGAWASATFYGTGFALIGDKATRTGQLQVRIDGGAPITIDTYSGTPSVRQRLYAVNLHGGKHTVTVTVLGTPYRPTVVLDGLGITH